MSISRVKHLLAGNRSRPGRAVLRRVFILSLCFALLAGTTLNASAFHLAKVKNKSFEKDGNKDGIPNHWEPSGTLNAKDKRVCNKSKHKKCSFKMVADGTGNVLSQVTLNSSGPAGIIATLSVWMRGKALDGAGLSAISIVFNQTDGGQEGCSFTQAGGSFGWTKVEKDCVASEPFNSMSIVLYTGEDSGKVWFDKVKLTADLP